MSESSEPLMQGDEALSVRLVDLADTVDSWAEVYNVGDDPYVTTLVQSIRNRDNLTAFATSDPLNLLPHPEPTAGRALSVVARFTAIVRNILVFVPVALTWFSISKATESFGEYARASIGDDEELSFLQFWQSGGPADLEGFTRLSSTWRITDIAFAVVFIIAAVIVLTAVSNIVGDLAEQSRDKDEQGIEVERTGVAVKILTSLQGNRSIDSDTLEETLAVVLNDLGQAARDVNTAAQRLEASSTGVSSLTPRIEELTVQVDALASKFSSDLQDGVASLANAVTMLGSTLDGDLQRFMADVLAGLEDVTDRLKTTSVSVEFGTKQLRDDLDAIHQRLASITRNA